MQKLFTTVSIPDFPFKINYEEGILLWGSCFSEHIYERLKRSQFKVLSNPFGITYNPISIAEGIERLLLNEFIEEEALISHEGQYHSLDFHGGFSANSPENALANMNQSIEKAATYIRATKTLILTLGTANVFRLKSDNRIVNNCHKLPGQYFEKKLLTVEEIYESLSRAFRQLHRELQILITVSPVRHIRDGLRTNQLSKSTLLLAANKLAKSHKNVHYFPSYEIMVDELRDYRFYKDDLIHPSDKAIDIIWQRFKTTFFDEQTMRLQEKIEKIWMADQHRPIHPGSPAHQAFIRQQIETKQALTKEYPFLKWKDI